MTSPTTREPQALAGLNGTCAPQRIRIDDADWQTYERFLEAIGDRSIRCTYDGGRLEIMAPMRIHEREKKFLGRVVETVTLELDMPLSSCGSMTIRREDLARGFEPDECYYIEHEPLMRAWREPDFRVDPPPDLAIEVDITSSSLDRLALYAALGVREVWRLDEGEIHFLHLQPDATYQELPQSRSFPFLASSFVNELLNQLPHRSETEILRELQTWLRANRPSGT